MRFVQFFLFTAICLLVVIGRPDKILNDFAEGPRPEQRQEEESLLGEDEREVIFEASSFQENSIADILWLKEAAEVALASGFSYFNVIDQKTSRRLVKEKGIQSKTIRGIIELEVESDSADYDAHEISNLPLPQP